VDSERSAGKLIPSQKATLDMAFSPDGRLLATVGRDESLRLWEVETGNAVATREEAGAWLFAVRFSPDARWLAIGGNEATIRIYGVRPAGRAE
jgi:WD40 repeat protein